MAPPCTVYDAKVVGVPLLESYTQLALVAKARFLLPQVTLVPVLNMSQRIDHCNKQWHTKLVLSSGTNYLTLQAFGSNITDIAQD